MSKCWQRLRKILYAIPLTGRAGVERAHETILDSKDFELRVRVQELPITFTIRDEQRQGLAVV